jgi:hypothetical protein
LTIDDKKIISSTNTYQNEMLTTIAMEAGSSTFLLCSVAAAVQQHGQRTGQNS